MKQVIYTKNNITSDGELITKEWVTKKISNTQQFVIAYVDDICKLAKCSGAEQSVILCCLKYLDYETNELVLTPARRTEISQCSSLKMSTINMSISKLYKKNFLIKKDQRTYLNPKIFFYGSELARSKMFKLEINYQLED